MSALIVDLNQLYRQTFGSRPVVPGLDDSDLQEQPFQLNGSNQQLSQLTGSAFSTQYLGKEIWLPVTFYGLDPTVFGTEKVLLPYSVIKISARKTIVKTPLAERQGTVKELYSVDDYNISLKGFVIDESNRSFPEREIEVLQKLFSINEAVDFDNALSNLFLQEQRVVIESLELPEVEGGRKHIRPFSMTLTSDSVFTLDV